MKRKHKPAEKTPVVCARCGWRGKRSSTSAWPACPRCGARAEMIVPQAQPPPGGADKPIRTH
jgi:predicted RNA-binding Zn-ribbon protein involved in translation (DUF1610 family)